jgi:hypothetical protein
MEIFLDFYLESVVLIGSDDGYGLRNPDAAEYIEGVCHEAAVISGLSIG